MNLEETQRLKDMAELAADLSCARGMSFGDAFETLRRATLPSPALLRRKRKYALIWRIVWFIACFLFGFVASKMLLP